MQKFFDSLWAAVDYAVCGLLIFGLPVALLVIVFSALVGICSITA